MSDEQAGLFIKAIYEYQTTGIIPQLEMLLDMALTPFINQFVRDNISYEKTVERNKKNGEKGGRPVKKPKKPTRLLNNPLEPTETHHNPNNPLGADSDSDSDSDSDTLEFKKFEKWILNNASRVSQMKEPFSKKHFLEIRTNYKNDLVREILTSMHNHQPILKNNISAYLTFIKWAAKRKDDLPTRGVIQMTQPPLKTINHE